MLHMILGIMRILGFLILFLIILLFALLLAVLFIPVRYHVAGSRKEKISAKIRVSWFLRILSFGIEIRGKDVQWAVRIFGYPVKRNEREQEAGKASCEAGKEKGFVSDSNTYGSAEKHEEKNIREPEKQPVESKTEQEEQPQEKRVDQSVSPTVVCEKIESVHPDDTKPQDLEEDPVKEKRFSVLERLNRVKETISDLCRKKDRLMNFWNRTSTRKAVEHGKKELFYLLRHIGPRNLRGTIRFGLEDPAMTGQILGVLSILQAFTGNHLETEADFDHKVLEGTAVVDGHIRASHFLGVFIRMLLDKHVRITVKGIRTLQL